MLKISRNKRELIAAFSIAVSLFLFSSCKKDQLPPPGYLQAAYFYIPYGDVAATGLGGLNDSAVVQKAFSTNFSFFFLGDTTVLKDTFWLPTIRVMGNTSPADRDISLVADTGSTAVAGKHYALLNNYIMKADSLTSKIGVVLFRSPDLNDTSVILSLKILPNAAFPAMVGNDTVTTDHNFFIGSIFRIVLTNKSVQPPYWADVQQIMGAWSRVKYQFIIDNTGKYLGLTPHNVAEKAQLVNYYFIVTSALQTYNNDHPDDPLKDENGNILTFSK